MPVFNLGSTFNRNSKGESGGSAEVYNTLTDQLSILENQLETDGKLSPADYDILIDNAKKLFMNPALTKNQRSNVEVKMSAYQKGKGNLKIRESGDVSALSDDAKDSLVENVRILGNNPQAFAQANRDVAAAKVDQLAQMIDTLDDSGNDSTKLRLDLADAMNDLNSADQILQDMVVYQKGAAPSSNSVAFVETNDKGAITNVSFGRPGDQTKYVATNGVYGGLQIYARPNAVKNGKKIFYLGQTTFEAPDIVQPDPSNPLAVRSAPLMATDTKVNKGNIDIGQINVYKDFDQMNMAVQSTIPQNGWAIGSTGILYQRKADGTYRKYTNTNPEQLGVNSPIRIPKYMEQSILPAVNEYPDFIGPMLPQGGTLPVSTVGSTENPTSTPVAAPTMQTAFPTSDFGTPQTSTPATPALQRQTGGKPTERAPQTSQGVASRVLKGAQGALGAVGGFFNRVFN